MVTAGMLLCREGSTPKQKSMAEYAEYAITSTSIKLSTLPETGFQKVSNKNVHVKSVRRLRYGGCA